MSDWYKLVNKIPVRCAPGDGFENIDARRVANETIGAARISTVFIGLDHQLEDGPPMLFETLVFGGALDGEMTRCSTWDQAEEMHRAMCARVAGIAVAPAVR